MPSLNFNNRRILVMGLGVHGGGVGVARFLAQRGAVVTATDLKSAEQLADSVAALSGLPIRFVLGEHREADFLKSDLIIRNPAVPRDSPFLQLAREHQIPVEMEMGMFFQICPAPIIGITGTKGKTTTTLLVGAMLSAGDPRTVVAGNLRVSALELLDRIDETTPVVLELSSWQLEGLEPHHLCPHIAAITNVYPDHLNRYRDMAEYAASKALIFQNQKGGDAVVLNADQAISQDYARLAKSRVVRFSRRQSVEGVYLSGDDIVYRENSLVTRITSRRDIRLIGEHNLENVLCACAVSMTAGVDSGYLRQALADFGGVPHRLELVREFNGVRFVNDTTSTAPASTIAALQAIGHDILLIAGGADKALDFEALGRSVATRTKAVILLDGSATRKLEAMIRYAGGKQIVGTFRSMRDAVQQAAALAQPGDTVLLSPASASFGLFANEFDRGEQFRDAVKAL